MESEPIDEQQPDWDLTEWESALTINVGVAYGCKKCGAMAMVSKGGVGVMELACCGRPMEPMSARHGGAAQ